MDFWTAPFYAFGTAFFSGNPTVFHGGGRVVGAGRIAIFIVTDLFKGAFVPGIVRDEGFLEAKIVFKEAINIIGIESGIPKEGIGMEAGMGFEEIRKDGF